jgi:hypothetical protein
VALEGLVLLLDPLLTAELLLLTKGRPYVRLQKPSCWRVALEGEDLSVELGPARVCVTEQHEQHVSVGDLGHC